MGLMLLALLLLAHSANSASAADDPRSKIAPSLAGALAQGETPMLVYFAGAGDISLIPPLPDRSARRRFVYDQMRSFAAQSQDRARGVLAQHGAPFRQHYLLNAMEVSGDAALAQELAALPEVTRLTAVAAGDAHLPTPQPSSPPVEPATAATIEWGVQRIKAPDVWNTYGVHGEGIVIGIADTGVQWDHPALKSQYRGWNGVTVTHTLNWYDAVHPTASTDCGVDAPAPCDDWPHGTHVAGIAVGDDGADNQIGVAPGAKWIACRNMAEGVGTIARYVECFEFMLAPFPQNGNPLTDGHPELGADIVNNSWTCTEGEGCDSAHLNDLLTVVQNLAAAGTLVVASAGNSGSAGCSSVTEPPAIYAPTFTVGATMNGDGLAGFSRRGPVAADGSNRMKPDLTAPGVSIRSSLPISMYGSLSGTSMASPHVAGATALLWSVVPTVSQSVNLTAALLKASADPKTTTEGCGGDSSTAVPNNSFGFGIVNVLAAVQMEPGFALRIAGLQFYIPVIITP